MDDKIKTYSPYLLRAHHINERSNIYNGIMLNPRKTFWLIKSHQTSSLFPPWKRWARHRSKDRKYPICKLNSRLFSHRVTYNENLAPAEETFQSRPLLLPRLVLLVPVITGLASPGGREEMFALNLPALKRFESGLPTSLHLRSFYLGTVRGGVVTIWQVSGPCSDSIITLRDIAEYQDIFLSSFELFTLVHGGRLFWWSFFSPMSIMEKYCQKEGTVCAPNISRVHVGLYEYLLLGREPYRNPPRRDVFLSITHCSAVAQRGQQREQTAKCSLLAGHWSPGFVTSRSSSQ